MTTRYCVKCGAQIGEGANFCPRCGAPAALPVATTTVTTPAAAPATTTPPAAAPRRGGMLIWIAIAVVALGLLAWAVLSGLPFGGAEPRDLRRAEQPAPTTIGEQEGTTTVSQIAEPTNETSAPPRTASTRPPTAPPVARATPPPPRVVTRTVPIPQPSPALPTPQPTPQPSIDTPQPAVVREMPSSTPRGEISEAEATQVLSRYLAASQAYDVSSDCLGVRNLGYKNVGYTLEVVDRCGGGSRGRWRVDSKTREVFRQSDDGRYVRP